LQFFYGFKIELAGCQLSRFAFYIIKSYMGFLPHGDKDVDVGAMELSETQLI